MGRAAVCRSPLLEITCQQRRCFGRIVSDRSCGRDPHRRRRVFRACCPCSFPRPDPRARSVTPAFDFLEKPQIIPSRWQHRWLSGNRSVGAGHRRPRPGYGWGRTSLDEDGPGDGVGGTTGAGGQGGRPARGDRRGFGAPTPRHHHLPRGERVCCTRSRGGQTTQVCLTAIRRLQRRPVDGMCGVFAVRDGADLLLLLATQATTCVPPGQCSGGFGQFILAPTMAAARDRPPMLSGAQASRPACRQTRRADRIETLRHADRFEYKTSVTGRPLARSFRAFHRRTGGLASGLAPLRALCARSRSCQITALIRRRRVL